MKTHFIDLFNYDKYASEIILKAMIDAGQPEKPVRIMAHMLAAQEIWLKRCRQMPLNSYTIWPEPNAEAFANDIVKYNKDWLELIEGLDPAGFEKPVAYINSKGEPFENKLIDLLTQIINHGTHHRAQIGQHLKSAGIDPLPNTDYISYIRFIKRD